MTAAHLGLDLGSTETKAVAYDGGGRVLAEHAAPTPWRSLPGGRTETTGVALLHGALTVLHGVVGELRRDHAPVEVASLGVTGVGESGVLLGADGRELAPVVAWYDRRGTEEVAALDPALRAEFSARTGLRLDAQASVATLLWLRAQGLRAPAGSCWLNVPEHVVHALGGERVSEPSLASRTGLLDQGSARPWPAALEACGLPATVVPELRPAGAAAGVATCPDLPAELLGAVLTVAGHDHPVACVGAGVVGADELFNGCGTADTLARSVPGRLGDGARDALVAAGFSAGAHVLPGTSVVLGEVRSGLVLRRVLAALGVVTAAQRSAVDDLAADHPGPVPGVVVTGGRAGDDEVRVTLHEGASPAAVLAAAVHHLTEETRALHDVLSEVVGPHRRAVAAGGWLGLRSLREAKHRVLPALSVSTVTRPGCRGAALLGAWAASGSPPGGLERLSGAWQATEEQATDPTGAPVHQPTRGAR